MNYGTTSNSTTWPGKNLETSSEILNSLCHGSADRCAVQYRRPNFFGNSELGYWGNAATGVSFPIIGIANAFAWCIGHGAASYLSICSGRQDSERAHKCVGTGITVSTMISILLAAVCLIFAEPLMYLFGASEQTIDMAVTYFRIISALFPCYLLSNVMNSMIRADGSPAFAMVALASGAVVNLILDPIFIYSCKWGIANCIWSLGKRPFVFICHL